MTPQTSGKWLASASALLFFWLCMILPLVGRAARLTDHYWRNFATFFGFLLIAWACAFLARRSQFLLHRQGLAPYPWLASALFWIYATMMLLLVTGRFHQ